MKFLLALLIGCSVFAEETSTDLTKLSEAIGYLIGKDLQQRGVPIDFEAFVRGLKDRAEGKNAPLTDEQCLDAIAAFQELAFTKLTEKNLQEAVAFLANNAKQEGVVSLEEGKLQYRIIKAGTGDAVLAYNSPLVRYKASCINGDLIGSCDEAEMVTLDETLPGFSKGILGMREGEIRTLYIHPDLGYGAEDLSIPNALLVFEVELVQADGTKQAQAAAKMEDRSFLP